MMTITNTDFWNAQFYDGSHSFVSNYGNDLIELLNPKQGEKILDLGCGTGDLANMLNGLNANIIGVDASKNMIEQAQTKFPHIPFSVMDAQNLTFENEFNAVFSNAALHWMKKPEAVVQGVYRSLQSGGRFVAEFGGAGNVQTITDQLIKQIITAGIPYNNADFPWYFPTIGEYTSLLESAGFHVGVAIHFSRPTKLAGENGLRNWLEMFSPNLFENVNPEVKERVFNTTSNNLKEKLYRNGDWYADYKRLRIVALKK